LLESPELEFSLSNVLVFCNQDPAAGAHLGQPIYVQRAGSERLRSLDVRDVAGLAQNLRDVSRRDALIDKKLEALRRLDGRA